MLLNVSSFAVYENGPQNIEYNRTNAQSYIGMYTTSPNSAYHYFTYPDEGGDCTNFASQVVRAGGMSMTAAVDNPGDSSWYYYGSSWGRGRSSPWTSATKFRTYWADVNAVGEKNAASSNNLTFSIASLSKSISLNRPENFSALL